MSEVRCSLGFSAEQPFPPPRCTGPIAECWRADAAKMGERVRRAWSAYVESERKGGKVEDDGLAEAIKTYGQELEKIPSVGWADTPETYAAISERCAKSMKAGRYLLGRMGASVGQEKSGGWGGAVVKGALVAGALVGGYCLLTSGGDEGDE